MPKFDPSILRDELADSQARNHHDLTEAQKFIAAVKGMLVSGEEYDWAGDTLRGILSTAEKRGIVTQAMRDAVQRIADKPTRGRDRGRRGGW